MRLRLQSGQRIRVRGKLGAGAEEGRGRGGVDLRAVGAGAGVGHGEGARAGVLEREVLVGELGAVDRLAAGACMWRQVNVSSSLAALCCGSSERSTRLRLSGSSRECPHGRPRAQRGPSEEAGLLSQAAERTLQRPSPFRRAGRAVAAGEVAALAHELRDHAVEGGALEVQGLAAAAHALLARAQSAEVLRRRETRRSVWELQSGPGAERELAAVRPRERVHRKGVGGEKARVHYQAGIVGRRANPGGAPPRSWARRPHAASSRCGRPARRRWSCRSRR